MSGYVEIITPDQTFEFRPAPNAVLKLRVVPDDVEKRFRKAATKKPTFGRGGREQQNFDVHQFFADVLDYAIVEWSGVRANGAELPCTRDYKLLLPEAMKLEINRQCLGKEGPEDADNEGDGEAPVDRKKA